MGENQRESGYDLLLGKADLTAKAKKYRKDEKSLKQTAMLLTERRQLTGDICELRFTGDTSAITRPGQFVNISLPERFLRRPISVCDWTPDSLTLICRVVGAGTQAFCNSPMGTEFDMLTGLGNGYELEHCTENPLLIGGGVGIPPLYGLAKRLLERGIVPKIAMGFNKAEECFYIEEFEALGCEVLLATMDGSRGTKGLVTALAGRTDCTYAYCCGPTPMLKAVHALEQLTDGQYSLEERMGCGFGACVGCTIRTANGPRRVCTDGPVFRKEELIWQTCR